MFKQFINEQYSSYHNSVDYYKNNPNCLIDIEHFVMNEILHFIDLQLPEIKRDYNEASYLYSFWKNYTPLDRGKSPIGDQYPCSLSPIYVLSDNTIAPLATFVIKPVYKMVNNDVETIGQPLEKIKIACIPNGLLLTHNPNYLQEYPELFFPGKDDKKKDLRKIRSRVSFDILKSIDSWRVTEIFV